MRLAADREICWNLRKASPFPAKSATLYLGNQLVFSCVRLSTLLRSKIATGRAKPHATAVCDLNNIAGQARCEPSRWMTLPLDQVAEGYRAMDERRAIKMLLRP
jgi:hypothetical protein